MHYTTIDEPEKTKIRTQDHALYTTIDNAHINPKHLCIGMLRKYAMVIDDVTGHVNPKHLYDETICHSARIGVKTLK
jgi:hypothetical protein